MTQTPSDQIVPATAMDAADEAFARAWMNGADYADALRLAIEAATPILVAAGRSQAAADIREAPYPNPSPCVPAWHAGYVEATETAARVAEGLAEGAP